MDFALYEDVKGRNLEVQLRINRNIIARSGFRSLARLGCFGLIPIRTLFFMPHHVMSHDIAYFLLNAVYEYGPHKLSPKANQCLFQDIITL